MVRRFLIERHRQIHQALQGAGQEVAVGRDPVHAPGARRALQEVGHRRRLHLQLRRKLVHARRPAAVAFEERRELEPQRLVLSRKHGPVLRQAQARALAREAPRVDQGINHRQQRPAHFGRARPDRFRVRCMPVAHRLLQPVAFAVPSVAPHHVARAAHLERHQIGGFRSRRVEHLLEPLEVHHAVVQQPREGRVRVQAGDVLAARRGALRRQRVHDHARAAQALRPVVAQQQPIAMPRGDGVRECEAREAPERREPRLQHRGAQVHADRPDARARRAEPGHLDIQMPRHRRRRGVGDDIPAPDVLARQAVQRERTALARRRALRFAAVRAQAAHARPAARRQDLYLVACADRAGNDGAGHDEPQAVDDEGTVDVQAKALSPIAWRNVLGQIHEPPAQRVHAFACSRGGLHDLRVGDKRTQFRFRFDQALRRHAIDLAQDGEQPRRAEMLEDRQVLARLRHRAVVGRDHEKREIDARHARRHIAHEALVPRHVDEGDRSQVGEAEVNGHPAALLLRQPVGVDAGERAYERGLAVVDVACGSDDHSLRPSN
ncbi:MAG: hypothetical protein WD886_03015 [Burkholderiales bacterium]